MASPAVNYRFLPWVRRGLAQTIRAADNPLPALRVKLPVTMRVKDQVVSVSVQLHGPGDVVGLDSNQVVRIEPKPLSSDSEPNYFPFIEFREPALPWLFTPLSGDGTKQLLPWICLVVVGEGTGVTYAPAAGNQLASLTIAEPKKELPDLGESWAWAHTQVVWSAESDLELLTQGAGQQVVSRLVAPRQLVPDVKYRACVVPTFEAGRQAGLGLPVTATNLQSAWDVKAQPPSAVTLPVYYDWEFATGPAGDFATLLQDLWKNPGRPGAQAGTKEVDVSRPGFGLDAGTMRFEGALCIPAEETIGPDDPDTATDFDEPCAGGTPPPPNFQAQLEPLLNIAAAATPEGPNAPVIGPPLYAAPYVGATAVPPAGQPPIWLRDLNLDPRYRAAASLGAMVVHHQQEQLLASAWDQLAQARRVNQSLAQFQAAREVSTAVHTAHVKPLPEPQLWQLTQAAHGRVTPTTPATLAAQITASRLPDGSVEPTLRRLARPQGPLIRRRDLVTNPAAAAPEEPLPLVASMNVATGFLAAPRRAVPSGTMSMIAVLDTSYASTSPDSVRQAPGWATWDRAGSAPAPAGLNAQQMPQRPADGQDEGSMRWHDAADANIPRPPVIHQLYFALMKENFRSASVFYQQYLERVEKQLAVPPSDPLPLVSDHNALLWQLHPDKTVVAAARDRVTADPGIWDRRDALDPVTVAPQFNYPMYEPLTELSPQWLLPNLEAVPNPCIAVLASNTRFVEAYLVGLNQAMGQELLWRDFPSHQVATYFRSFWEAGRPDVPDIARWDPAQGLGENAVAPAMVLLIRSQLLARYPNASISAMPAGVDGSRVPSGTAMMPTLRVTIKPDIALAAFDLTVAAATGQDGGEGWFFLIEEHITEPRFGLEPAQSPDFGNSPADWAQFSWGHLAPRADQLPQIIYASATQVVVPTSPSTLDWGPNSDAGKVAAITLRRPVRVAIHGSALLPTPKAPSGGGSQ